MIFIKKNNIFKNFILIFKKKIIKVFDKISQTYIEFEKTMILYYFIKKYS